jgi:asparagine synthase (glutamine-hydrolysing)
LKLNAENKISDNEFANAKFRFPYNTPATKEAYYVRQVFESHFPQPSARECVPGGPSIACSTPTAILWDESFAKFADCSGRSVLGVHTDAYTTERRDKAQGEAVKQDVLSNVKDIQLPGQKTPGTLA